MSKDQQGRKWQITINNPTDKGFDHACIQSKLQTLKSIIYWCLADEIGLEEKTPHTAIFIMSSSPLRFSTLQNLFDKTAHLERCNGTAQENKDYIAKTGRWTDTEKAQTSVEGTFEEWGEMPAERSGLIRSPEADILGMIEDGATNADILRAFPHYLRGMRDVDYVRQIIKAEEYRTKWRDVETAYIWGPTNTGKTRSVMDGYGYENVYRVTDYKHPFDEYKQQPVMVFDEYHENLPIRKMNELLDGYPIALPARYSQKQACYEKVFIISNLDLWQQYHFEHINYPEVFAAFIRRINKVVRFSEDGSRREFETHDYLYGSGAWEEVEAEPGMPFTDEQREPELPQYEQLPLPQSEE